MNIKKSSVLMVFVLVGIFILSQVNGYAVIKSNWSPAAFNENMLAKTFSLSINYYVVEGAGYFLKAHSEILLFLHKIELCELYGPDYGELQSLIGSAISNMEEAKSVYVDLTNLADNTPYDPEVIHQLAIFNYGKFYLENNLNFSIFWSVMKYLRQGDVRGIYRKMLQDSEDILDVLYQIETELAACEIPEFPLIWGLNHKCFLALIFDQYTSMVFYDIVQNN